MAVQGRNAWRISGARLVPRAVLALCLVATGVLYASILRAIDRRHDEEFEREIARLTGAVQNAVRRQVSVLQATAGAIAADPEMDQRRFATFYEHLVQGEDARDAEAVGLSMWRPWAQRGELAAEAAKRGAKNYSLRPTNPRPEAHAVVLLEPLDKLNSVAPGFDMHAEPTRAAAMDRARALHRPAMTSRLFLAKEPSAHNPAFIVYLPVYRPDGSPIGFVYSGLRADRLFRDLLPNDQQTTAGQVGLRLWSGVPPAKDLVYEFKLGEAVERRREFEIPLREVCSSLRAEIVASSRFGAPATILPWVLPIGGALSLLLFVLANNLRKAHQASERRESEQRLLAEVGRLTHDRADDPDILEKIALAAARTFRAVCRIDLLVPGGTLLTVNTRTSGRDALAALEQDFPRLDHDTMFRDAMSTGVVQHGSGYVASSPEHARKLETVAIGPVAVVPLWLGEHALGAITLSRKRGEDALLDGERALAESIAGRLALAIENQRLYRDLERRVEERTRDLEASNHELESFCYSVSHDLRTPLRSLDGFGRVLQKDYGHVLDAQGLDFLERIRAATRRMDELITALLTLSRLTRREIVPATVDMTAMARDTMHDLDPDGKVVLSVEEGLFLQADPRMMAVVLDNLLGNAIKFTAHEAKPEIEVGRTPGGEIFIRDNGAGFDMAYASKLFQPFERLHSAREFPGHGIGLATVERIVRRHGGEVRADSRPGEGATFYLRLQS